MSKDNGFANDEVVQIVHLDKSPDGEKYYLDVAVCIRSLGLPASLKERFGHYRVRLCHRLDPEFDELLFVFANAVVMDNAERERRFQHLLETKGIPLLDRLMSPDGMRDCYWSPFDRNVAVLRSASMLLFGTESSP